MSTEHEVVILGYPRLARAEAIARIRQVFGVDEARAAPFVDNLPAVAKRGLTPDKAKQFQKVLEQVGAQVEVRPPIEEPGIRRSAQRPGTPAGDAPLASPAIPDSARAPVRPTAGHADTELDFSSAPGAMRAPTVTPSPPPAALGGGTYGAPGPTPVGTSDPSLQLAPGEVMCQHCGLIQMWQPGCQECGAMLGARPANMPVEAPAGVAMPQMRPSGKAVASTGPAKWVWGVAGALLLLVIVFAVVLLRGGGAKAAHEEIGRIQQDALPAFMSNGTKLSSTVSGPERANFDIEIPAGQCVAYVATGECDLDASLSIDRQVVTFDQMTNGTPIVAWCSAEGTEATLEYWSFTGERCSLHALGYFRTMIGGNDLGSVMQVNAERFLRNPRPVGAAVTINFEGPRSEEERLRIPTAGCYAVVGQSLPGTDLDLAIIGDGHLVFDAFLDNYPIVEFCTDAPESIELTVEMYSGRGEARYWLFEVDGIANLKGSDPGYALRAR